MGGTGCSRYMNNNDNIPERKKALYACDIDINDLETRMAILFEPSFMTVTSKLNNIFRPKLNMIYNKVLSLDKNDPTNISEIVELINDLKNKRDSLLIKTTGKLTIQNFEKTFLRFQSIDSKNYFIKNDTGDNISIVDIFDVIGEWQGISSIHHKINEIDKKIDELNKNSFVSRGVSVVWWKTYYETYITNIKEYRDVDLGNFKKTLSDAKSQLNNLVENINDFIQKIENCLKPEKLEITNSDKDTLKRVRDECFELMNVKAYRKSTNND